MFKTFLLLASAMLLPPVTSGCSSSSPKHDADHGTGATTQPSAAVMCPSCETVWVREATSTGPKGAFVWQSKSKMVCPECDTMARAELDGKAALRECRTCKATPVRMDPAQPSHPKGPRN